MKLNLLKSLKKSQIYRKYCDMRFTNFSMKFEMPQKFSDPNYCLNWLRNLDEAHHVVQPKTFEQFDATSIRIDLQYMAIHGRSMFKPIIEIWN